MHGPETERGRGLRARVGGGRRTGSIVAACLLAVALLVTGEDARAAEGAPLATSVAVATGAVGALAPARGAPGLEVEARVGPTRRRWAVAALLDGWTLDGTASTPPTTELVGAVGPSWRLPGRGPLSFSAAVAPAVELSEAAAAPATFRVGLLLAPGLELATRRPSLRLDLGGRALFFAGAPRFALLAGARYSFQ